MIDLIVLERAVRDVEQEMGERGVSRATQFNCKTFLSALTVLTATREKQDGSNA